MSRRLDGLRVNHEAYEVFWRFAHERQCIYFRRLAGQLAPWTDDAVLRRYRFTNVYRAADRASQHLIKSVIYGAGNRDEEDTVFRILLFKLFNEVDTWNTLESSLGSINWRTYSFSKYEAVLATRTSAGKRLYSPAYILPNPPYGEARKHQNHLRLIEFMMRDGIVAKIAQASSLRRLFEILEEYPSIGKFLAFQMAIDINYSALTNFSEMDFVVAGPGARSGIRKVFSNNRDLSDEQIIRYVCENASVEFAKRGLRFQTLWGRPMQLIDCQNVFCEVDKYTRVSYPSLVGNGRFRLKRHFRPAMTILDAPWFPPKWRLSAAFPTGTAVGE